MHKLSVVLLTGFKKTSGLIGVKKPYPVHFKTRFGIHTFGLKFPIDVLITDSDNYVVKFAENLSQNRIFIWNPRHCNVVELPAGEIKRLKINIGSAINLKLN